MKVDPPGVIARLDPKSGLPDFGIKLSKSETSDFDAIQYPRSVVTSRAISKFESYAGHSGAPRSCEPGIHNHWQRAMDSGLATFGGAPE